ncbi:MAG: YIP1 family protein [Deltaproteobacteria bacterium]|nr:YIP1 family protein [Deltaproteobacteria bacterium]
MDFTIIYRVFYEPIKVFEAIRDRYNGEVKVFVIFVFAVFAIFAIKGTTKVFYPDVLYGVLFGFFMGVSATGGLLIYPHLIESACIHFFGGKNKGLKFRQVFAMMLLASTPHLVYAILRSFIDHTFFGPAVIFKHLSGSDPVLYGMISSVNVFSIWRAVLLWLGLGTLLKPERGNLAIIVLVIYVLEIGIGGFGRYASIILKAD